MDKIPECFAKSFFGQSSEIHPDSIMSLVQNGYMTRLSLISLDLVEDLSKIDFSCLAQRSLVRNFVRALQENCSFQEAIATSSCDSLNNASSAGYPLPHKKRRFEDAFEENDEDHEDDSFYQVETSPVFYGKANSFKKTSNQRVVQNSPGRVTSPNIARQQLSYEFENDESVDEEMNVDRVEETVFIERDETVADRRQVSFVNPPKFARTPPRIHSLQLNPSRSSMGNTPYIKKEITASTDVAVEPVVSVRRGRKPRSSVLNQTQDEQQILQPPKPSPTAIKQPQPSSAQSKIESVVLTPAQAAIRAKIEAKLGTQKEVKKRGRKRQI